MISARRNIEAGNIERIVRSLSGQSDSERKVLGIPDEDLVDLLLAQSVNGYCETIFVDDEAVAAFGLAKRDGFNNTWFIASTGFFGLGIAGIRYARERVRYYRSNFGLPLRTTSWSPMAEAPKWFKVLGFVEQPELVDGARVFLYK